MVVPFYSERMLAELRKKVDRGEELTENERRQLSHANAKARDTLLLMTATKVPAVTVTT